METTKIAEMSERPCGRQIQSSKIKTEKEIKIYEDKILTQITSGI